jgi:hypothetical protein
MWSGETAVAVFIGSDAGLGISEIETDCMATIHEPQFKKRIEVKRSYLGAVNVERPASQNYREARV